MTLLDFVQQAFRRTPAPVVSADGSTTYGPAVSRVTHTPIEFSAALPQAGQYHPATHSMTVNPANANDVGQVIRHESVHALLDGPSPAALTSGPAAQSLLAQMPSFVGDAQTELPAYLATNEPGARADGGTQPFDPGARAAALEEIVKRMPQQYPASSAAQYRALIQH